MFPKTYRALVEMIKGELLQRSVAKNIARKAGVRAFTPTSTVTLAPDSASIFSWPQNETYGYVGEHEAGTDLPFPYEASVDSGGEPHAADIMTKLTDFSGVTEARLIANVTDAGTSGASLVAVIVDGSGDRGFTLEPPSAPLDSVGFHVSPWRALADTYPENSISLAITRFRIDNPGGNSGDFSVGFCQLQTQ
jgi:hypothetical protein